MARTSAILGLENGDNILEVRSEQVLVLGKDGIPCLRCEPVRFFTKNMPIIKEPIQIKNGDLILDIKHEQIIMYGEKGSYSRRNTPEILSKLLIGATRLTPRQKFTMQLESTKFRFTWRMGLLRDRLFPKRN